MAYSTVNSWLNADGLYIKYGTDAAAPVHGGEDNEEGAIRILTFDVDLTKLSTTGGQNYFPSTTCTLDNGVMVEAVELIVRTAASTTSSPTFSMGFVQTDYTSTYPGSNPLTALINALTIPAVGTYNVYSVGVSGVGGFVGSTLTSNAAITCNAGTATYSAGLITVRLRFTVPNV